MEPIIEVKGLKKYFQTPRGLLHAVDDVTFSIERGKTLAGDQSWGFRCGIYQNESQYPGCIRTCYLFTGGNRDTHRRL